MPMDRRCRRSRRRGMPRALSVGVGTGAGLPELTLPCLGQPGSLNLRWLPATPVVLNLWASWCRACQDEMPALQLVQRAAGDSVLFLGIATKDGQSTARAFVADFEVTYASLHDRHGPALGQLGARGLPLTLVLGPDGTGPRPDGRRHHAGQARRRPRARRDPAQPHRPHHQAVGTVAVNLSARSPPGGRSRYTPHRSRAVRSRLTPAARYSRHTPVFTCLPPEKVPLFTCEELLP